MLAETRAFLGDLMVGPNAKGTLEDLFTSSTSFVDASLARIYALPAGPIAGMMRVSLDPGQRAGILTQLAFLTANASADSNSIVGRGMTVFARLLCQDVASPPPAVDLSLPPAPTPSLTTRERYEQAIANGCTGACHPIYPLGWAFENYDPVGTFRTTEPGIAKLIDPSGAIPLPSGELAWNSAVELSRRLPTLDEAQACAGKQWLRYLLRRKEGPGDAASLALAAQAFTRSSHDLHELVVALTRTRAFTHRTPAAGEVLP
jgi:hypothetical protein